MLGRDIEIKARKKVPEEPPLFYIRELTYGVEEKKSVRPSLQSSNEIKRIQATGWKAYLIEYVNNATLHGIRHLVAPQRHIFERIGAAGVIMMSLMALVYLSLHFWQEYLHHSTVIVLNHAFHNYKVAQPALVMCSKKGVDDTKFPEVFQKYGIEDTPEMRDFFTVISREPYTYTRSTPQSVSVPSTEWLSILHDLKLEIEYPNVQEEPLWVITSHGFCHSFYSYAAPYSNFEYWMKDNWTVIPEPATMQYFQHLSKTMRLSFHAKSHDVFFSLAHPGNIVDFSRTIYGAKFQWKTELVVNFEEVEPSSELRSLSFTQRNCKFPDEHKLKMWPVYTSAMCKRECTYSRMFKFCGCHHHFARPLPGIPTCDLAQLRCVAENQKSILKDDIGGAAECGCLPDCHYVRYTDDRFTEYIL
ncbi:uncharacterized protein [Fopius arisanus]|uniref:Uncharacterized protein n=1 Tax=Fopius arisanus TaxID=64838 RepID=A0A9R1TFX2_9HYME|nr:PREDICTED: uncharacterized protein LOC105270440 [Fopius arisanus]